MSKKYFLLLFIFWSLFSCTNTNKVEINSENISIDPEILYIEAMNNFDAKKYDLALDKFEKLEKLFPLSIHIQSAVFRYTNISNRIIGYMDTTVIIETYINIDINSKYVSMPGYFHP